MGIPLTINTDAHSESDLDLLHFGVATARRAWVTPPGRDQYLVARQVAPLAPAPPLTIRQGMPNLVIAGPAFFAG